MQPVKPRTYVILVLLAILGTCCLSGWPVRFYYTRMRGADLLIARGERIQRMEAIWKSLCDFQTKNGQFPQSQAEWLTQQPEATTLLRAPRWSRAASYEVHFDRLASSSTEVADQRQLLVEDPGIDWPGSGDARNDEWRVGLTPDGRIVSYSLTFPVHHERLSCP